MRAPASSPSLSKNNPTTSFLDGLHSAGFTTNDELTNLYTSYRAECPEVGMFKADWSLPEPTQDKYRGLLVCPWCNRFRYDLQGVILSKLFRL